MLLRLNTIANYKKILISCNNNSSICHYTRINSSRLPVQIQRESKVQVSTKLNHTNQSRLRQWYELLNAHLPLALPLNLDRKSGVVDPCIASTIALVNQSVGRSVRTLL